MEKSEVSEEKSKRVMSAVVSGLIVFIFILFSVLIYQIVDIYVKKAKIDSLNKEIAILEENIANNQSELASWEEEWKILKRARELNLYEGSDED